MLRVAYFSPLNPLRSGISDYSEELLPHLAEKVSLDLYVDGFTPSDQELVKLFPVFKMGQYRQDRYDLTIYHIGNNERCHEVIYQHSLRYPGLVVMHDFAIHHMIAAMTVGRGRRKAYLAEMFYCHGVEGLEAARAFVRGAAPPPWEACAMRYPLNKRLVDSARGVIAHSAYTRNRIKRIRPAMPAKIIYHHSADILTDPRGSRLAARRELGISEGEIILASFGFVTPSKRVDRIIAALAGLHREGYRFKYCIVGETAPQLDVQGLAAEHGLPGERLVVTGYLDLGRFRLYMRAADICFNLRYPVFGETSGSLHRLLGMGKPVLVSGAGSFLEYPDHVVVKIDLSPREDDLLYENIKILLEDEAHRERISRDAHRFALEYLTPQRSARAYADFITGICRGDYQFTGLIENLAGSLAELGFRHDAGLVRSLSEAVAGLGSGYMEKSATGGGR